MKKRVITEAVCKHQSPYTAELPYTLNWLNYCDWSTLNEQLKAEPIKVIDVGARGGSLQELEPLKRYIEYFGFDADAEEVARLASEDHGYASAKFIPYFVGAAEGPIHFNIFKSPGHSSALRPNPDYLKFSPSFGVDKVIDVNSTTLDALFRDNVLSDADFIKLILKEPNMRS
jgi:hypothetical protein